MALLSTEDLAEAPNDPSVSRTRQDLGLISSTTRPEYTFGKPLMGITIESSLEASAQFLRPIEPTVGKTTHEQVDITNSRPAKKTRTTPTEDAHRRQTRSSTVKAIASGETQVSARRSVGNAPVKLRRLGPQGKKPLELYHRYADRLHKTKLFTNLEDEYDFVNLFLKNMRDTVQRDLTTRALQQLYESKFTNQKIRIECRWDEVWAGLIRAKVVKKATDV